MARAVLAADQEIVKFDCSCRVFSNGDLLLDFILEKLGGVRGLIALNLSEDILLGLGVNLVDFFKRLALEKPDVILTELNLANNALGNFKDEEWEVLLGDGSALRSLNLSENTLSCEDVKKLVKILKENRALTALNFSGNFIEIDGARMLVEAMISSTTLKYLNLDGILDQYWNQVSPDLAKELAFKVRAENLTRAERRRSEGLGIDELPHLELVGDLFLLTEADQADPGPSPEPRETKSFDRGKESLGR